MDVRMNPKSAGADSRRELDALRVLVPALRRGLTVRRLLLDAGVAITGLEKTLEALEAPASIVCASGWVAHANRSAELLLDNAPDQTLSRLRDAVAGRELPGDPSISRLPDLHLIVLGPMADDHELRLLSTAARWCATSKEREVLRWLVQGDCNKEIALRLACAEVTVERHVTSLLRKAGCDSRSRLLATFWAGRCLR